MKRFDGESLISQIASSGDEIAELGGRSAVLSRADAMLRAMIAQEPENSIAFFVPGRIEFLGKHTDYAGGRSLLCAVDRGFAVTASAREDRTIRIADPLGGAPISFELAPNLNVAAGNWSNYAMAVARRIARNFPGELRGADIAFASDLPASAGMSSSSALLIGIYLALARINRLDERSIHRENIQTIEDLAGYLGTMENGQSFRGLAGDKGVGTFGGSQDHTAILCSRPGVLRQYSFCPVRHERDVALPDGHVLAIGASGVIAEKTGGARERYNAVSLSVTAIMKQWRCRTGRNDATLADAIHSDPDAADALRRMLGGGDIDGFPTRRLLDRLEQFLAESEEIIPAAVAALQADRWEDLGGLIDRSQDLSARWLGNQVPETIFLARAARENGAVAASAFGAGFGGSVWAMVPLSQGERFLAIWCEQYAAQFPEPAQRAIFFTTPAARPACEILRKPICE